MTEPAPTPTLAQLAEWHLRKAYEYSDRAIKRDKEGDPNGASDSAYDAAWHEAAARQLTALGGDARREALTIASMAAQLAAKLHMEGKECSHANTRDYLAAQANGLRTFARIILQDRCGMELDERLDFIAKSRGVALAPPAEEPAAREGEDQETQESRNYGRRHQKGSAMKLKLLKLLAALIPPVTVALVAAVFLWGMR